MCPRLNFNKHLAGWTIVQPEDCPPGRMGDRSALERITLESPEFERLFTVYASDAVEARYILTPHLMERIVGLKAGTGRPLYLSLLGDHVDLAFQYERGLFEPSLFHPVTYKTVEEVAEDFGLADLVVQELDLNVRIWTKGPAPAEV